MTDAEHTHTAHDHPAAATQGGGESSRIGELLSRFIPLSPHDVEEILHEQSASSHKRFGDIALQLGLCTKDDVLRAWLAQVATRPQRVSLDRMGVDTQALTHLDRCTARTHHALPIRATEECVVIAVAHWPDQQTLAQLERVAGVHVHPVLADEAELIRAIDRYYPQDAARKQPCAACA